MFIIKEKPDDFIVKEKINLIFNKQGRYAYYELQKKGLTTSEAVKRIAKSFNIDSKYINIAGNKDKHAVTTQFISINKGQAKNIESKDLNLKYVGNGDDRISLGCLEGNFFEITVRNVEKLPRELRTIINYFDDQRFGNNKDNHILGQLFVERNFKEVCSKLGLLVKENDFVGALRNIPRDVLRMYINAYQSYLWNENVKEYISLVEHYEVNYNLGELYFPLENIKNEEIRDEKFLLYGYGNGHREFLFREFPELSQEGDTRKLISEVQEFKIEKLDPNMYLLKFFLPKGCYATIVIKSLFG